MINCTDPECKLIKTYDSAEGKAIEEQYAIESQHWHCSKCGLTTYSSVVGDPDKWPKRDDVQ